MREGNAVLWTMDDNDQNRNSVRLECNFKFMVSRITERFPGSRRQCSQLLLERLTARVLSLSRCLCLGLCLGLSVGPA